MNIEFRVVWAHSAMQDLAGIIAYIAGDSPTAAGKVLSKIRTAVSGLYHFPHRGRVVPELQDQGIGMYRELVISPWRVVYRVSETTVLVLAVFDSRQNIEDILLKKLTLPHL